MDPAKAMAATATLFAVLVGGCANPADDSTPAKVNEPVATTTAEPAALPSSAAEPAAAPAGALKIDRRASKLEFVGSKVTGSHNGGFSNFDGYVTLTPDGKGVEKVRADIDMNSTFSDDERLTGHLKNADFFDVAKYPKSTFESTRIAEGGEKGASHTITGDLTLHGVTKSISFPATIRVLDQGASVTADFYINRKDFGIEYGGKADDLIRDEVVIKLNVRAPKAS